MSYSRPLRERNCLQLREGFFFCYKEFSRTRRLFRARFHLRVSRNEICKCSYHLGSR